VSEDADELLDIDGLCRHLGGNRPLNPATIYRAIKAGTLPKAIAITPGVRRWRRSEVDRMIAARAAERDRAA
jgi:predicted DNA-binding transcriptional regulator AlpA